MGTIFVKGNTKRGQELLDRADYYLGKNLYDVYGSYSRAKAKAMEECKEEAIRDGGHDSFRIISRNFNTFSVAWEYTNQETGEIMTKIKTAWNTYIIDGSREED